MYIRSEVPVLNKAPRHEDVLGELKCSSTRSIYLHYMEVSGHLHAPSTLLPGKDNRIWTHAEIKSNLNSGKAMDREQILRQIPM